METPLVDDKELKQCIGLAMQNVYKSIDQSTLSAAMSCVKKRLDREATATLMKKVMPNKSSQFVEEIFSIIERKKGLKRKSTVDEDDTLAKMRKFQDNLQSNSDAAKPNQDQISKMLAEAKKKIAKTKEKLGFQAPPPKPSLDAVLKKQKLQELQNRLKANLSGLSIPIQIPVPVKPTAPQPLKLDDQGRHIDDQGQVLSIPKRAPTLKANIKAKKQEQFHKKLQEKPEQSEPISTTSSYFDSRVKLPEGNSRPRRSFKFYEAGKFEKMGKKLRTKVQLDKLQFEISQAARRTGIQKASKLALLAPQVVENEEDDDVDDDSLDWWDSYVFKPDKQTGEFVVDTEAITILVEHPIQVNPPAQGGSKDEVLKTYLTKKERKKMRRITRMEALKDEQEKIRLGLKPPPEPKVKLSNLMRVLGNDAVKDPTKVEQHVRRQMEERVRKHEQANQDRKLTKEQRREKKIKKLKEDTSDVVHVKIYKVRTLRDPRKKYKIEMNSKQLYMTGITLMHPNINVVVVEGGPKAQRKFERLMMIRIKWDEDKKGKKLEDDDEDDIPSDTKWCEVLWEGTTHKKNFGDMTFKQVENDVQAAEVFTKHKVKQYWDLAHAHAVLNDN